MKNTKCLIYDYETLDKDPKKAVALCMAYVEFDLNEAENGEYTREELEESTNLLHLNIEEQVKAGMSINKDTLRWWETLVNPKIRSELFEEKERVSVRTLEDVFLDCKRRYKYVFSRGNNFDPIITENIQEKFGLGELVPFWLNRDSRTWIDSFLWHTNISNSFLPDGFTKEELHHPVTDVVADVMRIQAVMSA